jgi:predicted phosphodiesterase
VFLLPGWKRVTDLAKRVEEKRLQEAVQDRNRSVAEAERRKTFHPKGYEPGVEVKGDTGFITAARETAAEPTSNEWRELLEIWGLDPEVYEVDPDCSPEFRAWDNNLGRDPDTGESCVQRFYYYKAKVRLKSKWNGLNVDELLVGISRYKRPKKALTIYENPVGLVIPLSDWQIGKGDGDGVQGTLTRVLDALQMALDYYKELVKLGVQIECVYLIGMGDMIEQCRGNYPGQAFTTELNRREQIRLARRLLREWVVEFSKIAPHIVFGGVAGNHGENRNENNKAYTTPGDNDDVAVFEMVAEALMENDEAFGHVNFLIPEERLSVVLDICGVKVGFTHGHLSSRGADPQAKQKNWLKDMAFSEQPIGDAKLIVTGHYHHTQVVDHGPKTWIQCPAMDGGSQWWENATGSRSTAGTLAFCVGQQFPIGFDRFRILGFDTPPAKL